MLIGYNKADFEGIELYDMGQQFGGNYPIHYHRVRDIDGTVVKGNSIHKSFSRCITVHAADGVLVGLTLTFIFSSCAYDMLVRK